MEMENRPRPDWGGGDLDRPNGGCCEHGGALGNAGNGHGTDYGGVEGCGMGSWGLDGYPLATVYAPCQLFHELYTPEEALGRGTLFRELDLPLEAVGDVAPAGMPMGRVCSLTERRGV